MESRAFAEFGNGVWALFEALFELSAPVLASHWAASIFLLAVVLYLSANIWLIGKMHGSIATACKEDGLKPCLLMFFFGVPQVIWAFLKLLLPEAGEEDEI